MARGHRGERENSFIDAIVAVADTASWYCSLLLLALILLSSLRQQNGRLVKFAEVSEHYLGGSNRRPCEEIYVVGEGETLGSITDKCGDPFIVDRNPHIHDPDDVFPGLVIQIVPYDLDE